MASQTSYKAISGLAPTGTSSEGLPPNYKTPQILRRIGFLSVFLVVLSCTYMMLFRSMLIVTGVGLGHDAISERPANSKDHSKPPQYFDPNPELWPGPTATGRAPFLAQETIAPMKYRRHFGHLSPYAPNSNGFGADELPLPAEAKIVQVHMLHRHGSRYPTTGSNVQTFGAKIASLGGKFKAMGALSFLNTWTHGLGAEILVPVGRLELFQSGVNHYYSYGHLYNPNSKLLVRTTTQMRMRESAWNFMTGFFSFDWASKADLGYGIEGDDHHWNNSLAGYDNCDNSNSVRNLAGYTASAEWQSVYLQNATARINDMIEGLTFTWEDVYAMQTMCPYDLAAYAYSPFCDLFTADEWVDFEYSIDIMFAGVASFQSPTGRAIGIGWVQEFAARLKHQTLGYSGSQINTTLDSNEKTFPTNQSLYFDFSHDTNIMSVLTALGFTQFSDLLPADHNPGRHNLTVSQVTPFGARLDIEVIRTPHPVVADTRKYDIGGSETVYLRFKMNEKTLPHPQCGAERADSFCEVDTFLGLVEGLEESAEYDYACFGDYEAVPYGKITDGRPIN